MARIKYTDATGEHAGSLMAWEYYNYAFGAIFEPGERVPYFSWDNIDYEPFKRAVSVKYKTEVLSAKLI